MNHDISIPTRISRFRPEQCSHHCWLSLPTPPTAVEDRFLHPKGIQSASEIPVGGAPIANSLCLRCKRESGCRQEFSREEVGRMLSRPLNAYLNGSAGCGSLTTARAPEVGLRHSPCLNTSSSVVPHSSSSSAAPNGTRRICFLPNLISNSSPGSRPNWAV